MPEIRTWRDTPKPGETDGGWFYSLAREGHVYEIRGGFKNELAAKAAAKGCCTTCLGEGRRFAPSHRTDPSAKDSWGPCEACGGDGMADTIEEDEDGQ